MVMVFLMMKTDILISLSHGNGVPDDEDEHPHDPFLASLKKSIRHKTGQAQAEDSHLLI